MIDKDRLLGTFLDLIRIDIPSGEEGKVAEYLQARLKKIGFAVTLDSAGNLIGRLTGTGQSEPLLLNAHMDNVMPCIGVRPVVDPAVIRSDGTTVLGADDKSGVAAIIEALESQLDDGQARCDLEVVFTVQEESGLNGAKALAPEMIRAKRGIVVDHGSPVDSIVVQAPAQDSMDVTIHGRAAHAGVNPEQGINAIAVAAKAIARMRLGRLDFETTANVGTIRGGTARNIVPDEVQFIAEARSHVERKLNRQIGSMIAALEKEVSTSGARLTMEVQRSYNAFHLPEGAPIVELLKRAAAELGMVLRLTATGGGSDANIFNAHGVTATIMGTGYRDVHTTAETIDVAEFVRATQLLKKALALA